MYVDTHVHLTDEKFEDVDKIIKNYKEAGVDFVVNAGYDMPSSYKGKELADKYESVYFAAGIHPSDSLKIQKDDFSNIEKLLTNKKAVAYGEIGLDYHYEIIDKQIQKKIFLEQSEIAYSLNLPVIIHSRDATEDMIDIIKNNRKFFEGSIMHCFSGSVETAKIFLKMGVYISFAGPITFKNSKNLSEVAKIVPKEKILCETDCPYLSPEPFRGKLNEPKNVVLVLEKLAFYRNENIEELAHNIKQNALTLFKKIGNR
jgi:TatD DNase family protein